MRCCFGRIKIYRLVILTLVASEEVEESESFGEAVRSAVTDIREAMRLVLMILNDPKIKRTFLGFSLFFGCLQFLLQI